LAIKPSDPDTFMREVDEELRRERLNKIVSRYGWMIVGVIVLLLGAVGGYIWWQDRQQKQAATQGEALLQALDGMEAGNRNLAASKIGPLATSNVEGYRVAALFARASSQAEAGQNPAAIATLKSIADDQHIAEPYRQAALVRQTALEFDQLQPRVVIQRLGPLARPGQAWFGTAGEMVGIAHLRMHRTDLAGPLFKQIAEDRNVPSSIRTRAVQMAGSLGFNAVLEPSAQQGGQPSGQPSPAPVREKAE
jgi:hypothetical protein